MIIIIVVLMYMDEEPNYSLESLNKLEFIVIIFFIIYIITTKILEFLPLPKTEWIHHKFLHSSVPLKQTVFQHHCHA